MRVRSQAGWALGIDVGGTFTDLVATQEGRVRATSKVLTSYPDPGAGVMRGLGRLLVETDLESAGCAFVVHATTLASNAVIEGKTAPIGFITTKGFRDVLWLRREDRYYIYDPANRFPEVLVRKEDCIEADERVKHDGDVVAAVPVEDTLVHIHGLIERGVRAVAVGFLHSYANPVNERRLAGAIRERWPQLGVVASHEVSGEGREYERFVTTVIDAALMPIMSEYLRTLSLGLTDHGFHCPHYVLTSAGDAVTFEQGSAHPVTLLESGPAAGHVAACRIGRAVNSEVLAFDMGGTTAKVGVSVDGSPILTKNLEIGRMAREQPGSGYPVVLRSIDLREISAGGGSIARIDPTGLLDVGPDSAGSVPGPACYGQGGAEPTITDANVHLRWIDPEGKLGDEIEIDENLGSETLGRLGLGGPDGAALGIRALIDEKMSEATRLYLTESQVRQHGRTLIAFGGAGGLHAAAIATRIGVSEILCPREAGVLSAWGLALARLSRRGGLSCTLRVWRESFASEWSAAWLTVEERVGLNEGESPLYYDRVVEMSYVGQPFSIDVALGKVPRPDEPIDTGELSSLFAGTYRARFGKTVKGGRLMVTAVHLSAVMRPEAELDGLQPRDSLEQGRRRDGSRNRAPISGTRSVLTDKGTRVGHSVIRWPEEGEIWNVRGPSIIQAPHTAAVVPDGWRALSDRNGNIWILEGADSG